MNTIYPAKYRDHSGEESIIIETDGRRFFTTIRNIRFEGISLESLDPQDYDFNRALFTLEWESLTNCDFEFEIPVLVVAPNETVEGTLQIRFHLGKPRQYFQLKLLFGEHTISSRGNSGGFETELYSLQGAMPEKCFIKCCFYCAFSEYWPGGGDGPLACFRDNKAEFLKVHGKPEMFKIWDTMTEYVQETHLCPEFQPKRYLYTMNRD